MLIYWLFTVLNCLSIQFSLSKSIEWAPTPGSNTTLSEANIVLLNEDGVIMINQHHGVFQLGRGNKLQIFIGMVITCPTSGPFSGCEYTL